MKIVFHEGFKQVYSDDPAAEPGRMEAIASALEGIYEFIEAEPCREEDVLLIHEPIHVELVKGLSKVYPIALLAVGGALKASEIALEGEPSFALIRPPGHHAGPSSSWGFCYFNNIAVAVEKALRSGRVGRVVIVDFDLHFGDGTEDAFKGRKDATYYHMPAGGFPESLENFLDKLDFDLMAVSAGFDRSVDDWGGILTPQDFMKIGKLLRDFAERKCSGRRFAVLEGGYNRHTLGRDVKAFLEGFD